MQKFVLIFYEKYSCFMIFQEIYCVNFEVDVERVVVENVFENMIVLLYLEELQNFDMLIQIEFEDLIKFEIILVNLFMKEFEELFIIEKLVFKKKKIIENKNIKVKFCYRF